MGESLRVIFRLFLCCLVPVAVSVMVYLLQRKTKFGKLPYIAQQIIIGVLFGGIAIFGTEVGVDVGGAMANVRDTGPLCAGLIFGGPAGIIAGIIGGVERWFAVYWGVGSYTRVACSLSTVLAGFYAAGLRKFIFNNDCPNPIFGFFIGCIMEVIHLVVLFITKLSDLDRTYSIIKILAVAMIFWNGFAVGISSLVIDLFEGGIHRRKKENRKLANQIQLWLLVTVTIGLVASSAFVYMAQTNSAYNDANSLMKLNITDVEDEVKTSTEYDLKQITQSIKTAYDADNDIDLVNLASEEGVDEINIIEMTLIDGIEAPFIVKSTNPSYVEVDMTLGEQSNEFNCLLPNAENHLDWFCQELRQNTADHEYLKYAGMTLGNGINGYIQVGYKYEKFESVVNVKVQGLSNNRHVGNTGLILVADKNQKLVSSTVESVGDIYLSDIGFDLENKKEFSRYSGKVYFDLDKKENAVYMYAVAEGYYVVATMPEEEVFMKRDNMLYMTVFVEILVFALLFVLIYILIKHLVVVNVDKINDDLGEIIDGNLDVKLDSRGCDEFEILSNDINSTVDTLKEYIAEAASRIDKELEFAKSIQLSALPNSYPAFPHVPSVDITAKMFTAKEVGGDFYDYYMLDANHIGFLIADVSGKGIPAAMFMMQSKATIKNYASRCLSTCEIMANSNAEICAENDAGMFVTCWFAIINTDTGEIHFTSAGHNPPLVYRNKTHTWEYLKTKCGLVLGAMDVDTYGGKEFTLKLEKGDRVYLYTDGVTEATRGDKELYGEDRLLAYLNTHYEDGIVESLDNIKNDIDKFIDGAPQFDDITMVMIEFKGK